LTAGTIDASEITVTNLNADNITTGTINGQRLGEGSISLSKLSESVYTEGEVYCITDLWWAGFFNSSDVYNSLKVGNTYRVYVSGNAGGQCVFCKSECKLC